MDEVDKESYEAMKNLLVELVTEAMDQSIEAKVNDHINNLSNEVRGLPGYMDFLINELRRKYEDVDDLKTEVIEHINREEIMLALGKIVDLEASQAEVKEGVEELKSEVVSLKKVLIRGLCALTLSFFLLFGFLLAIEYGWLSPR